MVITILFSDPLVRIQEALANCFERLPMEGVEFPAPTGQEDALLHDWSLYTPNLSDDQCLSLLWSIFERLGLLTALKIDEGRFKAFLLTVRHNYRPNPYHNYWHAVDVTQCIYLLLQAMPRDSFAPLDLFSVLIAAIGHDVCHPSFNNHFHCKHATLTACLFNDRSPLENLHSLIVCAILREYDFTSEWTREQRTRFYAILRASILGTDMACHFDYLRQLNSWILLSKAESVRKYEGEDAMLLLTGIIKAADLCNVIRPFGTARRWGLKLISEFFHQGDWDRLLISGQGLGEIDVNFDRHACNVVAGQLYFLEKMALPLYQALVKVFPGLVFTVEELQRNLHSWSTVDLGDTSTL